MPMRVIAGKAKGRQLKRVPGEGTRPIMDRVKEALFNILADDILDSSFLDLYAGTGSVGIEALSRGAARVVFVENARSAIKTIEENLRVTGLTGGEIRRDDVLEYLKRPNPEAFEIIYIAPPQYKGIWIETLQLLDSHPEHLHPDGVVVIQIDPKEKGDFTEPESLVNLVPGDERKYGKTLLWFFERPGE
jgi:16S rRNA (guanine966-N2)-methyltransferase